MRTDRYFPMSQPPRIPSIPSRSVSLLPDQSIEDWVQHTFGPSMIDPRDGVRLVVKFGGEEAGTLFGTERDDAEIRASIRELTSSFRMHGGGPSAPGALQVKAPSSAMIRRALNALVEPTARRRTLGAALSIFGRRVVAPLEHLLSSDEEGATSRLRAWRNQLLAQVSLLGITHETQQIITGDLARLLSEDYILMLGENEEKTLRPQLSELAQKVLDVLGTVFYRAFDRFSEHIDQISETIVRNLPKTMSLRDMPSELKRGFVSAVTSFLAVETSTELKGSLGILSIQYASLIDAEHPLAFDESWYGDVAAECWQVISGYC